MHQVIRIRDQKVFNSISAAAESIGTPYNYLSKCIDEHKLCKGELFEIYHKGMPHSKPIVHAIMSEGQRTDRFETMYQQIFQIMLKRAYSEDMSLDEVYHKFISDTEGRFQ